MNKYIIELSDRINAATCQFDSELDALDSLHDTIVRIIEQVGLDPADPKSVDIGLGVIVRTDHPALGVIFGALSNQEHKVEKPIPESQPSIRQDTAAIMQRKKRGGGRKHFEQEKRIECPNCHKMVGTLVKSTGICKPCHMLRLKQTHVAGQEKCPRCERIAKLTKSGFCNSGTIAVAELMTKKEAGPQEKAIEMISRPRPALKLSNLKGRKL